MIILLALFLLLVHYLCSCGSHESFEIEVLPGNHKQQTTMFRHTLLLAHRSFLRFKSTFFINLIGLSTGLAGALLIYLWVSDELAKDKFHQKESQLYQVLFNIETPQGVLTGKQTPVPLAAALLKEMPEVEQAVAVDDFTSWRNREGVLSSGEKHIKVQGLHAGKDFFHVFSFLNPAQSLKDE